MDLAALKHPDLAVPQAWGVAIQEPPAGFDGIRYGSRFHGGACLALFDRDSLGRRLRVAEQVDLAELPAGDAFLKRHGVGLV